MEMAAATLSYRSLGKVRSTMNVCCAPSVDVPSAAHLGYANKQVMLCITQELTIPWGKVTTNLKAGSAVHQQTLTCFFIVFFFFRSPYKHLQ